MVILQLSWRNLLGRKMMTWLNVLVLSVAFVTIIWTQGLFEGMGDEIKHSLIEVYYGGGQYWHKNYDPYDPITFEDSHALLPEVLQTMIIDGKATPILATLGTIFPDGRAQVTVIKGIDPAQRIIRLPSSTLAGPDQNSEIPAFIGTRMAEDAHLQEGDYLTVRWRDVNGVFDAADICIVHIMSTTVQMVDDNQIWIPIENLRRMLKMPGEASIVVTGVGTEPVFSADSDWVFHDLDDLLSDITELVRTKSIGSSILYALLLFMALLAIFNTQVLSIFRRKKEIGTLIALGMTRSKVIQLFTFEGALHGVLAALIGAVYGIPLCYFTMTKGIQMPVSTDDFGMAIPSRLYSSYSWKLVLGTTIIVLLAVTIVSFLPTRKLVRLKPTEALKGKVE
jgi:ABC-type lipoprotein release transport system permease subunit